MEGKKEEDEKMRRGQGMRMMKDEDDDGRNAHGGRGHLEKEEKSGYSSIIHHPSSIIHRPSSMVNHHRKAESSSAESMGGRVDEMIDEIKMIDD